MKPRPGQTGQGDLAAHSGYPVGDERETVLMSVYNARQIDDADAVPIEETGVSDPALYQQDCWYDLIRPSATRSAGAFLRRKPQWTFLVGHQIQ